MANAFNKIFLNKGIYKKKWTITGVQTDPTQDDEAEDYDIKNVNINLIISKEQGFNDLMATMQIDGQEYSFILYDEIIKFIDELRNKKEV